MVILIWQEPIIREGIIPLQETIIQLRVWLFVEWLCRLPSRSLLNKLLKSMATMARMPMIYADIKTESDKPLIPAPDRVELLSQLSAGHRMVLAKNDHFVATVPGDRRLE
jgi:hypothetical protein